MERSRRNENSTVDSGVNLVDEREFHQETTSKCHFSVGGPICTMRNKWATGFLSLQLLLLLLLLLGLFESTSACSDILVTPGASEDGSAIIAYNADDVRLFGYLYHYPSSEGKEGQKIQIYEWDSGVSKCVMLQGKK